MLIRNQHADYLKPLEAVDAEMLGVEAAETVECFLSHRPNHRPTPLRSLPARAQELGLGAIHLKDEGYRLGLGSFKALGGAYAVIRLVLEAAEKKLGRPIAIDELHSPEVAKISAAMTFGCATDGNHGRSVAQGAQLVGARSVIFVHAGVSDARVAPIARYGAVMERVAGTYDDSVAETARVCEANGWTVVSDTSWPGYERIPGLVMQGYTAIFREALEKLPQPPAHVFIQSGVGGIAAAASGYLASRFGEARPTFIVVDPARAACIFETAPQGKLVKLAHGEPTVMNLLARLFGHDPVVVAGESGGAGLAGLLVAARDPNMRAAIGLDAHSRVLLVITEGATDPDRYRELVGLTPGDIAIAGK